MKTINRNPMSVKQLGYNDIDYKFFTQADWKGINEDENVVTVDPETFAEAENVYINEDGILKSRPGVIRNELNNVNFYEIDQWYDLDNYVVGTSSYSEKLYNGEIVVIDKNTNEVYSHYPYKNENVTLYITGAIELNKALWVFYYDTDARHNKFVILQFVKSTHEFITDNNIYIPTTKIYQNGLELTSSEEENLLTNKVKTSYNYIKTNDYSVRDYIEHYFNINNDKAEVIVNENLPSKEIKTLNSENDIYKLSLPGTKTYNIFKTTTLDYYIKYNKNKNVLVFAEQIEDTQDIKIYYSFDLGKTVKDTQVSEALYLSNIVNLFLSEDGSTIFVIGKSPLTENKSLLALSILPDEQGNFPYQSWTDVLKNIDDTAYRYVYNAYDAFVYAKTYNSFILYYTEKEYNKKRKAYILFYNENKFYLNNYYIDEAGENQILPRRRILFVYYDINYYYIVDRCANVNENSDIVRQYKYNLSHSKVDDEIIVNFITYNLNPTKNNYNNFLYYNDDGDAVLRLNFSAGNSKYTKDIYFSKTTHKNISSYDGTTYEIYYLNEFNDVIKYGILPYGEGLNVNLTISKYNNTFSFTIDNDINFYYINGDSITYYANNKICSLNNVETAKIIKYGQTDTNSVEINRLYNLTLLQNVFASNENNLYISSIGAYYKDDKDYIYNYWYFPKINKQTFPTNIKQLHIISSTTVSIFLNKEIYYTLYDENVSAYRYYKSKIPLGTKSNIITSYDGKYTLFITEKGLAALSYQDFISSDEQSLTFLSDAIYSRFTKMFENTDGHIFQYKYWIFCYVNVDKIYILDTRNNSWWYFTIPFDKYMLAVKSGIILYKIPRILCQGSFIFNNDLYYDKLNNNNNKNIDWRIKSQKLYLSSINYYKHIVNISLNTALDSNKPALVTLKVKNYRKRADYGKNILGKNKVEDTISFNVDIIRTFVKRLNYYKVNAFEYELSNFKNDNDVVDIDAVPLSLTAISIKYLLTGQVR